MRIAVTGAESSGTRLMSRILQATGADVVHCPVPRLPIPDDVDHLVVMERCEDYTAVSQLRARHVDSLREAILQIDRAQKILRSYDPSKMTRISYEVLVSLPEKTLENLCVDLGLAYPQYVEEIYNGNEKYYEVVY